MTKTFAAITTGGGVLFAFEAANSKEARETCQSLKTWSEKVEKVRLLKADDLGVCGAVITHR